MSTPADPSDIDAEIARLMHELSSGTPSLNTLRAAVAACKPPKAKREAKPKRPRMSPAERMQSRIRGRYRQILTQIKNAEAVIAASAANPKDVALSWAAITPWAQLPGLRANRDDMHRSYAEITAAVDAELLQPGCPAERGRSSAFRPS
jgi:hypothetical protein